MRLRAALASWLVAVPLLAAGLPAHAAGPPLTAAFENVAETHDGAAPFTFGVRFSEPVATNHQTLRDRAFTVTGGTVTGAGRVDVQSDLWQITVTPDEVTAATVDDDITIILAPTADCDDSGAICTASGSKRLSNSNSVTVIGPMAPSSGGALPLSAVFEDVPDTHNGNAAFMLTLRFSEPVATSDETLRDHAFTVTGGAVTAAQRHGGRSDLWHITVTPDQATVATLDDDITITLAPTAGCSDRSAVCTPAGGALTTTSQATVSGPLPALVPGHAEQPAAARSAREAPEPATTAGSAPSTSSAARGARGLDSRVGVRAVPGSPGNLTFEVSSGQVTLSWGTVTATPEVTAYLVRYRIKDSGDAWSDWTRTGAALDVTETITGLADGTIYEVGVAARSTEATSAYSMIDEAMPVPTVTLATGHDSPTDMTSDGTTVWVLDSDDDKAYAYTRATWAHDSDNDFDLESGFSDARGICLDGDRFFVVDSNSGVMSIYDADSKEFRALGGFDLDVENTAVGGMACHNQVVWVADASDHKMYAYRRGSRSTFRDVDVTWDDSPSAVWRDDTTMWVLGETNGLIRALNYTLRTLDADAQVNYAAAGIDSPAGMWSDGTDVWVSDSSDGRLYQFTLPELSAVPPSRPRFLRLESNESGQITMTWERHSSSPPTGIDFELQYGLGPDGPWLDWERVDTEATSETITGLTDWVSYWMRVRATNDEGQSEYNVAEPVMAAPTVLLASGNAKAVDMAGDDTTVWVLDTDDDKAYAYTQGTWAHDSAKDFDLESGNNNPDSICLDSGFFWVSNAGQVSVDDDDKVYAYAAGTKAHTGSRDIDLDDENDRIDGMTCHDGTMWVGDFGDNILYAYDVSDGSRDEDADIDVSDFVMAKSIWTADGDTMWVHGLVFIVDGHRDVIRAYDIATGTLDADLIQNVGRAVAEDLVGMWSDGTHVWLADSRQFRIPAPRLLYQFPLPAHLPGAPSDLEVTGVDSGQVTLEWQDTNDTTPGLAYEVQYRLADSEVWLDWTRTGAVSGTSETITGLTVHSLYSVRVRAVNNGGASDYVELAEVMPVPTTDLNVDDSVGYFSMAGDGTTLWMISSDEESVAYATATGAAEPLKDFLHHSDNATARGSCLHGGFFWIVDDGDDRVYAYNETTRTHDSAKSFDLADGHDVPTGVACHDGMLWIADQDDEQFYVYSTDGARVPARDFFLPGTGPLDYGAWTDGITVWIGDNASRTVKAYDLATGADLSGSYGIDGRVAGLANPGGLWSDGTTMWILDWESVVLYQLPLPQRVITAPGPPTGVMYWPLDAGLLVRWVPPIAVPQSSDAATSYAVRWRPTSTPDVDLSYTTVTRGDAAAVSERITGLVNSTSYTVQVRAVNSGGNSRWMDVVGTPELPAAPGMPVNLSFVSAETSLLLEWDRPAAPIQAPVTGYLVQYRVKGSGNAWTDWTPRTSSDPLETVEMITGLDSYRVYEVQVAARNGPTVASIGNFASIGAAMPTPNFALRAGNEDPFGLWVEGSLVWVADRVDDMLYSYNVDDSSPFPIADLNLRSVSGLDANSIHPKGVCTGGGGVTWVGNARSLSPRGLLGFGRDQDNWVHESESDIDLGSDWPEYVSCDDATLLAAVTDNSEDTVSLRSYDFPDRTRNTGSDIDTQTLVAAGISRVDGIWSDGLTVWVADGSTAQRRVIALSALDGARREWLEVENLGAAGNLVPRGIASDGTHMWIVDDGVDRVFKYLLPTYEDGPPVPVSATVSADGMTVSVDFSEALDGVVPDAAHFKVAVGSAAEVSPSSATHTPGHARTLTLTLTTAAAEGAAVTIKYTDPAGDDTTGVVQDVGGADAPSFTKLPATPRVVTTPSVPTNLAVTPRDALLEVSWLSALTGPAASSFAVRYRVTTDPDVAASYTTVTRSTPSSSSETITGLVNGTGYTVQVRASNASGSSGWVSIDATPAVPPAPSAPQNLAFVSNSAQLRLSWDEVSAVPSVTGYVVRYRVKDSGDDWTAWTRTGAALDVSETITGLVNHTIYEVGVAARTGAGEASIGDYTAIANAMPVPKTALIDPPSDDYSGLVSDGTTVWIVSEDDASHAFVRATGARDSAKDVTHTGGNNHAVGQCLSGGFFWLVDESDHKIYAYSETTRDLDSMKTIDLTTTNADPHGVACYSDHIWVTDTNDDKVYTYRTNGTRNSDIDVDFGTVTAQSAWTDGTTMWIADTDSFTVKAYDIAAETDLSADYGIAVSAAGLPNLGGMWSDGTTMWILDGENYVLYEFALPQRPVSVPAVPTGLEVVGSDEGQTTLEWVIPYDESPGFGYEVQYRLADSDTWLDWTRTSDADTASETITGLTDYSLYSVRVRAVNDVGESDYAEPVTVMPVPATALVDPPVASYLGVVSDGTTVWIASSAEKSYAFVMATGARDSSKDIDHASTNSHAVGQCLFEGFFWIAEDFTENKMFAYNATTRAVDSTKTFDLALDNGRPQGVACHGGTIWVADVDDNKMYAYETDGDRVDKDIELGSVSPRFAWTDGTTIWIGHQQSFKIRAYDLATGTDLTDDYGIDVRPAGLEFLGGVWSDGTNMWIHDGQHFVLYKFPLPQRVITAPGVPTGLVATSGDTSLSVSWTAPTAGTDNVAASYGVRHRLTSADDVDASYTTVTRDDATLLAEMISGLTNGTGYTVQVRAVNAADESAWASVTGTPTAPSVTTEVPKNWRLKPAGLDVGDQFRLLFVSSTTRFATTGTISFYDTHVQDAADGGHAAIRTYGSQFKAVGSTSSIDARDHTGTTYTDTDTGVPIYYLGGAKVADDYEDFYDGSWDSHSPKDEAGSGSSATGVWTGSNSNGTAHSSHPLGNSRVRLATPTSSSNGDVLNSGNFLNNAALPLYGLSPVFEVSDTVAATTIASVAVTSTPVAAADTYGVGEVIEFTVTFYDPVEVSTNRPHFQFSLGSTDTTATYESGSGTTALTFNYTVVAADMDDDGIWIGNQSRTIEFDAGEYIRNVDGGLDANLDHSAPGTQSGHKVNGSLSSNNDATLSALTLMAGTNAVTLTPSFASDTTAYRAWVANSVSSVAVTATKNDDGATVAITDDDAISTPNSATLTLAEGANTITVTVAAGDDITTETYTVTVVRVASAPAEDSTALLTANVTAEQINGLGAYGYWRPSGTFGALTDNTFDYDGTAYTITVVSHNGANGLPLLVSNQVYLCLNSLPANSVVEKWTLRIGSVDYPGAEGTVASQLTCLYWQWAGTTPWAHGDIETVKIFGNQAATGSPTISGTAQVGQTLTAAKGTIADRDDTTKADSGDTGFAYEYQWIRMDGSDETEISSATLSTYVPVAADVGKKVKVKVSFTDDRSNEEERTSAAYPATGMIIASSPPSAPQSLSFVSRSGQLELSWEAPSSTGTSEITAYEVQYRVGDTGAYTTVMRSDDAALSETVTGLVNYTVYEVQVAARNGVGLGAYATIAEAMPALSWPTPDASNGTGFWSDGNTAWVVNSNGVVRGYALSDFSRAAGQDLNARSLNPQQINVWGICSDGTTTWVLRISGDVAHAYERSGGSWSYVSSKDIDLGDDDFSALWCNTELMLASVGGEATAAELRAYDLPGGARNTSRDVDTQLGNVELSGLWSDGLTVWLVDPAGGSLLALSMLDGTRREWLDIDTLAAAGHGAVGGIWSNGDHMWAVAAFAGRVYRYPMPSYEAGPPVPRSAVVSADGATVEVTFTEALATGVVPDAERFKVVVGSAVEVSPSSVAHTSGDDTSVTLTLSAAAGEGVAVTVAYDDPADEQTMGVVQDAGGADAPSFTKLSATPRAVTVPGVPTGLAAAPGAASLVVSWSAPATGGAPATYGVRYRLTSADDVDASYTTVDRSDAAATSETISGLVNGTPYTVQVRAENTAGESAWVAVAGTPAVPATPSAPLSLSFVSRSGQLELSWEAPSSTGTSEITAYEVQYRVAGTTGAYTTVMRGDVDAITETVTGLVNYTVYEVQVAARNGVGLGAYATIAEAMPALSWAFADVVSPSGLWSEGTTAWVTDSGRRVARGYELSDFSRDAAEDLDIASLNPAQLRATDICSDGTTTWFLGSTSTRAFAYERSGTSWSYVQSKNVSVGFNDAAGLWCDEESMLAIAGGDGADVVVRAFDLPSGARNADRDIDTTDAAGFVSSRGLWSDGVTAWAVRGTDGTVVAFSLFDGSRRDWLDIDTPVAAGNNNPRGIWANDDYMWVVDRDDDRVYRYPLPQYADGPPVPRSAVVSADGMTVEVTFTEALATGVVPDAERFKVVVGSAVEVSPSSVAHTSGDDTSVTLTLSAAAGEGVAVTVAYDDPVDDQTTGVVQDAGGADAPSFTKLSATPRAVTVPGVPTGLAAAPGAASLVVSWSAPATGGAPATYGVRYRLTSADDVDASYTTVDRSDAAATSETISGLVNGTPYTVQVRTMNTAGESAWVAVAGTPAVPATPSAPLNLSFVSRSGQLELSWEAPSSTGTSEITAYDVQYRVAGTTGAYTTVMRSDDAALSETVTGLVNYTVYEVQVAARNEVGLGAYATIARARPVPSFSLGSTNDPRGVWSDGTTVWVVHRQSVSVMVAQAYSLSDFSRVASEDLPISTLNPGNSNAFGICSDGTTTWVSSELNPGGLFAYGRNAGNEWEYRSSDNIRGSGLLYPWAVSCDEESLLVVQDESPDTEIWGYTLPGRTRNESADITPHADNANITGLWANAAIAWVNDAGDEKLYAYARSDGSRIATLDLDYSDSGIDSPQGVWSDGTDVWIVENDRKSVFKFPLPQSTDTTAPEVMVEAGSTTNSFKATDGDPVNATAWRYAWIAGTAACNSGTPFPAANTYTEAADLSYTVDQNTMRACFRSADTSSNSGYGVSAVVAVDVDAPEVTVGAGSTADSFKATDKDLGTTIWHFAWVAGAATCGSATTFPSVSNYSEGDDVVYTDSRNGQKLCFRSTDTESNSGYGVSPVVAVDVDAPEVTVGAGSAADSFKATDKDLGTTIWHFAWVAGAATCGSATTFPSVSNYSEGDDVVYTDSRNGQKLCFRSTDTESNSGYGVSPVVAIDVTAPMVIIAPGNVANSFKATDGDPVNTTTWQYVWVAGAAPCGSSTDFGSATNYTEGRNVTYTSADNGSKICFRSTDTANNAGHSASPVVALAVPGADQTGYCNRSRIQHGECDLAAVGLLEVGQRVAASISSRVDDDWFRVEMGAGKRYRIDMLGLSTGDGTLRDPYLRGLYAVFGGALGAYEADGLLNAESEDINGIWYDCDPPSSGCVDNDMAYFDRTYYNDDGGVGLNARIFLSGYPAGMYYIEADAVPDGPSTGTYVITLTELTDDDSSARSVTLGTQTTGELDYPGDDDVFEVTLEAGTQYNLDKDRVGWYNASLTAAVSDPNGAAVDLTYDRDGRVDYFTADSAGTYRITIAGYSYRRQQEATGPYTLTVTER